MKSTLSPESTLDVFECIDHVEEKKKDRTQFDRVVPCTTKRLLRFLIHHCRCSSLVMLCGVSYMGALQGKMRVFSPTFSRVIVITTEYTTTFRF